MPLSAVAAIRNLRGKDSPGGISNGRFLNLRAPSSRRKIKEGSVTATFSFCPGDKTGTRGIRICLWLFASAYNKHVAHTDVEITENKDTKQIMLFQRKSGKLKVACGVPE